MFGKSENREDYQYINRPVGGMARNLADNHQIAYHQHPRGQLIYAYSGVILVTTELGSWVVPPQRAVWVPPEIMHSMRACGNVEMRTVYIRADRIPRELTSCCVVSVPPLLRELISAMVFTPLDYEENGRDGLVAELLLNEIKPLKVVGLNLPMPADPRLLKICRRILADPADEATVDDLSNFVGASARTIIRLFP
jgi:mannose-6-phosphate isomerase-like protein (cupin superfamily)